MYRAPSGPRSPDLREHAAYDINLAHTPRTVEPVVRVPVAVASGSPEDRTPQRSSWDLVFAVQGGDSGAFAELYRRHYSAVFAQVIRMVYDYSQAEDVTSEAFLRAYRQIKSVRDQGKDPCAWFVAIARNIVIDMVRSAPYRREIGNADVVEHAHDAAAPDEQVVLDQTKQELRHYVRQLGEDQRRCVVLRFFECRSVSETAEIMGRKEAAIRALQHRAIRKLSLIVPQRLGLR